MVTRAATASCMRGGRFFDRGDLRYVLLHLISEKPRHGYEAHHGDRGKIRRHVQPQPGRDLSDPDPCSRSSAMCGRRPPAAPSGSTPSRTRGGRFCWPTKPLVDSILARMAELTQGLWRRAGPRDRAGDASSPCRSAWGAVRSTRSKFARSRPFSTASPARSKPAERPGSRFRTRCRIAAGCSSRGRPCRSSRAGSRENRYAIPRCRGSR